MKEGLYDGRFARPSLCSQGGKIVRQVRCFTHRWVALLAWMLLLIIGSAEAGLAQKQQSAHPIQQLFGSRQFQTQGVVGPSSLEALCERR